MKHATRTIAIVLMLTPIAAAKNVDLSTIPPRDTVQLTIYNSEDLTLVRETRKISLKKGINPLQFSWAGTLIDPTSVDVQFKTHKDELDLLDTTFPHQKPQMLYWSIRSDFDGAAVLEISYFTSGISWSADYACVTDPATQKMSFDGFVRITNNSGEDYADAQIRMVVGTINLVQKIRDLATRGIITKSEADDYIARRHTPPPPPAKRSPRAAVARGIASAFSAGDRKEAKQIIKEGLSEYFIYTVPGTETVRNTWSKRMRLFHGASVPFKVQYRYRPAEYGDQLVRMFILRNDESSSLGETPLPNGIVRLFRDNGNESLSYLLTQSIKYVPIGQEIELNLGADPEVLHERIRLSSSRDGFWFHRARARLYFSPTEGHRVKIDDKVAGWDDHQTWIERIRNFRDKPIDVEIRRSFDGHVTFRSNLNPKLHDFRSPQFATTINPGEKKELKYELVFRQGYNKKQDNVTLEKLQ
jgi:hypothetical protein